jgi:hypothetical protein
LISYLNKGVPVGSPRYIPLFILLGHVTETSSEKVSPGDTDVGDTETVQSVYDGFAIVVVVVGGLVVVVATTVVVVTAAGATVVGGTVVVVAVVVVGGTVSKAIDRAELALFPLPTASENAPAPTEIEAVPEVPATGVKVAVYEVPEPLKPDNAPPETVTSPTTKFEDVSDKVNVNTSVPPTPKEPEPTRDIETVGEVPSIVTVPVDATETLPAASAAYTLKSPSMRPVTDNAKLVLIVEIGTEFHRLSAALVMLARSDTATDE